MEFSFYCLYFHHILTQWPIKVDSDGVKSHSTVPLFNSIGLFLALLTSDDRAERGR